jgi:hypothetical protein
MFGNAHPVELNPHLRTLIEDMGHALPISGAHAGWVRDPEGHTSRPRLFINVGLYSPDMPNANTNINLASNVPPGFDLARLTPAQLDPVVLMAEEHGGNHFGALYTITQRAE